MTDLATFNPFDPDTLQCPFPHYAQMRDEQPVMHLESMGMYLVTRYDLVLQIVRDVETYSSQFGMAGMAMWVVLEWKNLIGRSGVTSLLMI